MATPENGFRNLTDGETAMLKKLFGTSIPYEDVKIYNRKWTRLQDDERAVAPNGNIYIPPGTWFEEDFSKADPENKHNFMHEMAHVWQYHRAGLLGVVVPGIKSALGFGYGYKLDPEKTLADYSLEGQADILADYYFEKFEGGSACSRSVGNCGTLNEYEIVLKDFLANQNNKENFAKPPSTDPLSDYRF